MGKFKSGEEDINGAMEPDQKFEAMGRPGVMRLERKRKFEETMPAHPLQFRRDRNTLDVSNVIF